MTHLCIVRNVFFMVRQIFSKFNPLG